MKFRFQQKNMRTAGILGTALMLSVQVSSLAAGTGKTSKPGKSTENHEAILKEVFAIAGGGSQAIDPNKVWNLEAEALKLQEKGDDRALDKFQQMYGLCKEFKFADGEGHALIGMASEYLRKGQVRRAKELIENALEVLSASQDKKSLAQARVVSCQVYLQLNNPLWAMQQLDLAMKDFISAGSTDSVEAAKAMALAGDLAARVGDLKETVQFYRGAAAAFSQAGNPGREIFMRLNAVNLLLRAGMPVDALEDARKAEVAARETKEAHTIASTVTALASVHYQLGEFATARKLLEDLRTGDFSKASPQPPVALAILNKGYASSLAALGDLPEAYDLFRWSLSLLLKYNGPAIDRAETLNALGVTESLLGKHADALKHMQQALDAMQLAKQAGDGEKQRVAQNIALAEARTGQYRASKEHLESLIKTILHTKSPDAQYVGKLYCSLAEVCIALKELPQAQSYLDQAISFSTKVSDDASLWRDYTNLAKLQSLNGIANQEALKSAQSFFRSPQAGLFPTPESLNYPSSREDLACEMVSMLVANGQADQALLVAEQLKQEAYIAEWQKSSGEVKDQDKDLYTDLVNRRNRIHIAERALPASKVLPQWADWLRRFQMVAKDNPQLAKLIAPLVLNLNEICQTVKDNGLTIVDYLIGNKASFVFTIDSQGKINASKLTIAKATLQSQISSIISNAGKTDAEGESSDPGYTILALLYNELLPPAVSKVLPANPDQVVVIVPDQTLFSLPFAALRSPNGKFLVEDHTLTTVPDICIQINSAGNSPALVVSADSQNNSQASTEIEVISKLFEPSQVIQVPVKETEVSVLQEQLQTPAALHISAKLPLSGGNWLMAELPYLAQGEKNKATTGSLFKLNLASDLAVWNGTWINAKETNKSGVGTFSRGLSYAGVRNLLLSLWLSPQPARIEELAEFYKGRKNGMNQAQSLRKAQLLAISRDPAPKTWAAFQLVGPGD